MILKRGALSFSDLVFEHIAHSTIQSPCPCYGLLFPITLSLFLPLFPPYALDKKVDGELGVIQEQLLQTAEQILYLSEIRLEKLCYPGDRLNQKLACWAVDFLTYRCNRTAVPVAVISSSAPRSSILIVPVSISIPTTASAPRR